MLLAILSATAWTQNRCNLNSHGDFEDAIGAPPDPWVLATDGGANTSIVVDFGYDNVTGTNQFGGYSLLLQSSVLSDGNGSVTVSQNVTLAAHVPYNFNIAFYTDTGGSNIVCAGQSVVYTIPGLEALQLTEVSLTTVPTWIDDSTTFVPYVNGLWQISCQAIMRPGSNSRLDDISIRSDRTGSCDSNVTPSIRGYHFMSCQNSKPKLFTPIHSTRPGRLPPT